MFAEMLYAFVVKECKIFISRALLCRLANEVLKANVLIKACSEKVWGEGTQNVYVFVISVKLN